MLIPIVANPGLISDLIFFSTRVKDGPKLIEKNHLL